MLPHQTAIQVSLPVATARRGREDQHEHVIVELAIRNRHRNGSFVHDPALVPDPAGNIPEFREWILDRDRELAAGGLVEVERCLGYRPAPGVHGNDFCRDAIAKGMGKINLSGNHLANLVPWLVHRDFLNTLFVFHSQAGGCKIDYRTRPVEQADIDQVVTTRHNRQSEFGQWRRWQPFMDDDHSTTRPERVVHKSSLPRPCRGRDAHHGHGPTDNDPPGNLVMPAQSPGLFIDRGRQFCCR